MSPGASHTAIGNKIIHFVPSSVTSAHRLLCLLQMRPAPYVLQCQAAGPEGLSETPGVVRLQLPPQRGAVPPLACEQQNRSFKVHVCSCTHDPRQGTRQSLVDV